MEKTVYFVRHGQSVANASAVFQPPESPLSETGRRQAACVARRISGLGVQALLSSPLERAKGTAEAIAQATGLMPEYSGLFVERMKPASINGRPFGNAQARAIWTEWNKTLYTPGVRVEDGENFDGLIARADAALAYLQARAETSIAVVTHGYFFRTVVARAMLGGMLSGEAFKRFQRMAGMENTGLAAMGYGELSGGEPGWRVLFYNDHAHLSECPQAPAQQDAGDVEA
jgi:broad specificity phosphatase PhoE